MASKKYKARSVPIYFAKKRLRIQAFPKRQVEKKQVLTGCSLLKPVF
jgi:hypothetical protein